MNELQEHVLGKVRRARAAALSLANASTEVRNRALHSMADALWQDREAILLANEQDMASAKQSLDTGIRLDRLRLTESRIQDMMEGLRQIAALPDPLGEVLESFERPNGLQISRVRVPLGVLAVIYEARPNVTVDSAGLAVKSGNAIVLRGGREALHSNQRTVEALCRGLSEAGVDPDAIQFIDVTDRASVDVLLQAVGMVDVAIPRGGAGLIRRVQETARVPVIETGVGNCHVYVHESADLEMASRIVVNAKTQRPSVCNAMETLLVDERIATMQADWFASLLKELRGLGVEVRACDASLALLQGEDVEVGSAAGFVPASEEDYATEFLDLIMAVKLVSGLDEALTHIARYGTRHSEAIVCEDDLAARRFLDHVDAAAVYHNASTRFTDGFEFGFGAEIGISTQKLHARGPMGLRELTSYKYIVQGAGQTRG